MSFSSKLTLVNELGIFQVIQKEGSKSLGTGLKKVQLIKGERNERKWHEAKE